MLLAELRSVPRRVFPHAGVVAGADIAKEGLHFIEARLARHGRVNDGRQRARAGDAHQRPRGNQIGEVQRGRRLLLGFLNDGCRANGELRLEFRHRREVLLERGAILHVHAAGFEPFAIEIGEPRARAGRADIAQIRAAFDAGGMRRSDLVSFLGQAEESSRLILGNTTRAAELIRSFKRVSVDQASEERRRFLLAPYLNEILVSLSPNLKRQAVKVMVDCPADLELDTFPGALSQVITNCVINSLIHGFDDQPGGALRIDVTLTAGDLVEIRYADDGKGIPPDALGKIFDPFFTTRRSTGGSGLGLHIVYNLVATTLNGEISVASHPGEGATFTIRIPRIRPDEKTCAEPQ